MDSIMLLHFKFNKNLNPFTNRKIKPGGAIYKKLEKALLKLELSCRFIQHYYRYFKYKKLKHINEAQCVNILIKNDKDPISLDDVDTIPYHLSCYININNNVYKYHINSVIHLRNNNIQVCPFTRDKFVISSNLEKLIQQLGYFQQKVNKQDPYLKTSVDELAKDIFHDFTLESIYLDHTHFINLPLFKLQRLHYEWKDMFNSNTTTEQKRRILGYDSYNIPNYERHAQLVFPTHVFTNIDDYRKYLIQQMCLIMRPFDPSLKTFTTFIILGGLTLVCPEYSHYKHFTFDF